MELVSFQSISIYNALVGCSTSPWWDIRVGQVGPAMHSPLQGVLLAAVKMCWIRRDFWRRARWLPACLKREAAGVVNHYATHPKQTHGWWENTTCFCWQKPASLPTHTGRHAPPHLKKKVTENVGPVMANVRYGNTICMHLCLHIEQCLKHKGHFLKYGVCIKQTGILSVLRGSVYLSLVMNFTGLIFKSKTLSTSSLELAAMK